MLLGGRARGKCISTHSSHVYSKRKQFILPDILYSSRYDIMNSWAVYEVGNQGGYDHPLLYRLES